MSTEMLQGAIVVLLTVVAVAIVLSSLVLLRALTLIRAGQNAAQAFWAARDPGPALHGLVQQTREATRLLTNIDKRLEKLEALEKVQIANLGFRDAANR